MIILSLLTFVLPLVYADVEFTSPTAGANVPAGPITVRWKNSERSPSIQGLTQYTLNLMVGGNNQTAGNMLGIANFASGGDYTDPWLVKGVINASVAAPIPNGFFLQMISTSSNGGILINYSDRFTITGLDGVTASEYRNAAEALHGNTNAPPRGGNVPAVTSASSSYAPTNGPGQTVTVTKGGLQTSSSMPGNSNNHTGPGAGVIAGVVILCLAFFFGAIGLGVWAHLRRKRRRRSSGDMDDKDELGKPPSVTTTSELSELSADGKVMEMGDGIPPPEMDSTTVRVELEGDNAYEASDNEALESPWEFPTPLTPIGSSINGEETLCSPMSPLSTV